VNKVIVTIACAAFAGSAHAELIDVRLTPGEIVEKRWLCSLESSLKCAPR